MSSSTRSLEFRYLERKQQIWRDQRAALGRARDAGVSSSGSDDDGESDDDDIDEKSDDGTNNDDEN